MAEVIKDANHIHVLENFNQEGLDYLPGDIFREKPNLVKFLLIYLDRLKAIDQMLVNLAEGRLLANATYYTLDEIGRQVGVDRNGMDDDSYRASITILLASSSKHGTRDEVLETLRQLFGTGNFSLWKGENFRVDINIFYSCFELSNLISEIEDMLPLPTHLRLVESEGRSFAFDGDNNAFGFASVEDENTTIEGGISGLVYTSDDGLLITNT